MQLGFGTELFVLCGPISELSLAVVKETQAVCQWGTLATLLVIIFIAYISPDCCSDISMQITKGS